MKEKIHDFYDLEVWKRANKLTVSIYHITKRFSSDERFGLTDQLRRAASSISANIAEGFGRYHPNDKIRFYLNSRGSASECKNHIILARGLGYINEVESTNLLSEFDIIGKQINSMINSIRSIHKSRLSHP